MRVGGHPRPLRDSSRDAARLPTSIASTAATTSACAAFASAARCGDHDA